jgi:uncharacterized protein involved in exopolysaccharide biosynthesis
MALSPITPRDRLQRLVDLARKTWRYWWLVVVFAVAGGALSLAFAVTRPRNYLSWATLFYQERIQSQLLSPNREEIAQRNIGDRYRELLLARKQLDQIINDPNLDPYPQEHDPDLKMEKLRLAVHFVARGAMAFRIEFIDSDPDRAKRVTERLTKLLQDTEEAMRNEQAAETVKFATKELETESAELRVRDLAYKEFLAKNPEFVSDATGTPTEGKSILAARTPKAAPKLSGKERQLQRIVAMLSAPPDAPPVSIPALQTPERLEALAKVQTLKRELEAAKRELDEVLSKYTDKHPSAIKAQDRVNNATQLLRLAEAAVPPETETVVRPATPEIRAKLEKERQQLEAAIRDEQSRSSKPTDPADATEKRVVRLETENTELRGRRDEQRARVQSLTEGAFRAKMDANQKLAEQGGRLSIVDPAFKPARPSGPGKTIFLMAGMVLFVSLGLSLAIAFAVIDDRLYRRADLDHLGIAVLAVIPPAARSKRTQEPKIKIKTKTKRKGQGGVA